MNHKIFYLIFFVSIIGLKAKGQVKKVKPKIEQRQIGITFGSGYKKSFFGEIGLTYTEVNELDFWTSVTLATERDFTKNATQRLKLGYWRCYNFVHAGYGGSIIQTYR
jgi:hypothetical protein